MESLFSSLSGLPWLVILPDTPGGAALAERLHEHAGNRIEHSSGHPWLLGSWAPGELAVASTRDARVAVMGQHGLHDARLAQRIRDVAAVTDLDRFCSTVAGSVHVLASVGGVVRAQGTLLGHRPLFHARTAGVTVLADRADVLAALIGARPDEELLACHLLFPAALHPVTEWPVFAGVHAVPADSWAKLDRDGGYTAVRRWRPPSPTVPMTEAAPALREALDRAVAARLEGGGKVSADLAGLDSTSLVSLAARRGADLFALTAENSDPLDDDLDWARITLSALPPVEHHVIPAGRLPLFFDGMAEAGERFDAPCFAAPDLGRFSAIIGTVAAKGSRLHLNGFGGDEVLHGSPAYFHRLLRTRPLRAWRSVRAYTVKHHWSMRDVLRQLVPNHPYRTWLAGVGDQITLPPSATSTPLFDWGFAPRLAPWMTADAEAAVRAAIRRVAGTVEPLSEDRGQHFDLQAMIVGARSARQYEQIARRTGVVLASPFYDDAVMEIGLSVQPFERVSPWRFKPLITEAMTGVVPSRTLARATKAHWTAAQQFGLQAHRGDLQALAEDSRLAALGLVDADLLREQCDRPTAPEWHVGIFDTTVACETWLRSIETITEHTGGRGAS